MNDEFKKYLVQPNAAGMEPLIHNATVYMEVNDEAYIVYVHENDLDMATPHNFDRAADHQCLGVQDVKELWSTDFHDADGVSDLTVHDVATGHDVDVDDLITKYNERLQDVYDNQTAGRHTFVGVLTAFLMELEGK